MFRSLTNLARGLAFLVIATGVFFAGYKAGRDGQKIIYQDRYVKVSENHAKIEQRQAKVRASRDNYDLVDRLHKASF